MTGDAATRRPIRVLVVDDSAFMRTALSRMIASESGFEVTATACSGSHAPDKIPSLDPDVITLDGEMPGLDGLQTLRCIMRRFPRPVIMVSAATEKDADNTFDALAAGAFDYVPKQLSPTSLDTLHIKLELIAKIRAAAQSQNSITVDASSRKPARSCQSENRNSAFPSVSAIVALGTSTGGPRVLQEILPLFPRDLAVPILIVQHIPPGFTAPFAQRLNTLCSLKVHEATHSESIQPGVVYIGARGSAYACGTASQSHAIIFLEHSSGRLSSHSSDRRTHDLGRSGLWKPCAWSDHDGNGFRRRSRDECHSSPGWPHNWPKRSYGHRLWHAARLCRLGHPHSNRSALPDSSANPAGYTVPQACVSAVSVPIGHLTRANNCLTLPSNTSAENGLAKHSSCIGPPAPSGLHIR